MADVRQHQKCDALIARCRALRPATVAIAFDGVGHRVVHGGPYFTAPVRIDARVLEKIESLAPLRQKLATDDNLMIARHTRRVLDDTTLPALLPPL
ncbi:acetate kinase [Burkholderia aenigmatica]|uniref:Acetate kinase n=1 Tax=Burkholderia aenigmatica TaxID=2015348 RepID=A0A6J5IQW4_9BURK|nr:hypothetical protein CVS37_24570 [Burkholderia lata]CAB3961318.1 acetate kinase [Burkholderia aenigmatica]VWC49415.1 acetate kinase [Burkholderia aenigmatica]VWC67272.1 acetate kinase [Burkholderia aenigmatica]VWD14726.1 acetate kinase [Burkholderia aenigmatica]